LIPYFKVLHCKIETLKGWVAIFLPITCVLYVSHFKKKTFLLPHLEMSNNADSSLLVRADGWAAGGLEELKLRLTQPSLARTGAELGNRYVKCRQEIELITIRTVKESVAVWEQIEMC
jgi:hypothetical protein